MWTAVDEYLSSRRAADCGLNMVPERGGGTLSSPASTTASTRRFLLLRRVFAYAAGWFSVFATTDVVCVGTDVDALELCASCYCLLFRLCCGRFAVCAAHLLPSRLHSFASTLCWAYNRGRRWSCCGQTAKTSFTAVLARLRLRAVRRRWRTQHYEVLRDSDSRFTVLRSERSAGSPRSCSTFISYAHSTPTPHAPRTTATTNWRAGRKT